MSKFAEIDLYRSRAVEARRDASVATDEVLRNLLLFRASQYDIIVDSRVAMTPRSDTKPQRSLTATAEWMPLVTQFYQDVGRWILPTKR